MGHSSRHSPGARSHEQPQEVKESASDEEMDSSGGSGPRDTASETEVVVRHRGTAVAAEVLLDAAIEAIHSGPVNPSDLEYWTKEFAKRFQQGDE